MGPDWSHWDPLPASKHQRCRQSTAPCFPGRSPGSLAAVLAPTQVCNTARPIELLLQMFLFFESSVSPPVAQKSPRQRRQYCRVGECVEGTCGRCASEGSCEFTIENKLQRVTNEVSYA